MAQAPRPVLRPALLQRLRPVAPEPRLAATRPPVAPPALESCAGLHETLRSPRAPRQAPVGRPHGIPSTYWAVSRRRASARRWEVFLVARARPARPGATTVAGRACLRRPGGFPGSRTAAGAQTRSRDARWRPPPGARTCTARARGPGRAFRSGRLRGPGGSAAQRSSTRRWTAGMRPRVERAVEGVSPCLNARSAELPAASRPTAADGYLRALGSGSPLNGLCSCIQLLRRDTKQKHEFFILEASIVEKSRTKQNNRGNAEEGYHAAPP